jgi:predicted component of type VI protein secretion system
MEKLQPRVVFSVSDVLREAERCDVDLTFHRLADFSPQVIAERALASLGTEYDRDRLAGQINLILHHPELQRLEAVWRGLRYLVENSETSAMLKIRVFDISKS